MATCRSLGGDACVGLHTEARVQGHITGRRDKFQEVQGTVVFGQNKKMFFTKPVMENESGFEQEI